MVRSRGALYARLAAPSEPGNTAAAAPPNIGFDRGSRGAYHRRQDRRAAARDGATIHPAKERP